MKIHHLRNRRAAGCLTRAFTLFEVLLALGVCAMTIAAVIYGYVQSAKRAEWSAYSLAAQSLTMQRLEMVRACKWDPNSAPAVDQLVASNFPALVNVLDIPTTSSNLNAGKLLATNFPCTPAVAGTLQAQITAAQVSFVYATSYTTITLVSTNPMIKAVQVDCVWPFLNNKLFTNTVVTYRAPDT
ncbi:MAG: hypothetical protein HY301_17150 [Verrucomicrobia bacterium]|nr:hypothetical protein [Verrucomicrobiota bacterium]